MTNGWTPERRARQSELIRTWRPWDRSTGPTTEAGKATASGNANTVGWLKAERDRIRELKRYVRDLLSKQRELMKRL